MPPVVRSFSTWQELGLCVLEICAFQTLLQPDGHEIRKYHTLGKGLSDLELQSGVQFVNDKFLNNVLFLLSMF